MQKSMKKLRLSSAALLLAALLVVSISPTSETNAQSASTSTPTSATLSESTIKTLQELLNKQGITVKTDGVLNDETRNALRNFQSQHHLPVTGEADQATLHKLGVVAQLGTAAGSPSTVGQAASPSTPSTPPPQAQTQAGQGRGEMMTGPMMQGMMQGMMQTMQGMMGMMQGQMEPGQRQMQPRPMHPGRMQRGPMQVPQEGSTMNCPMMPGSDQASAPAMMQMMQGMMQMMQMMQVMQGQMQPAQKPQGAQ